MKASFWGLSTNHQITRSWRNLSCKKYIEETFQNVCESWPQYLHCKSVFRAKEAAAFVEVRRAPAGTDPNLLG